jgi:hypothetical protein
MIKMVIDQDTVDDFKIISKSKNVKDLSKEEIDDLKAILSKIY